MRKWVKEQKETIEKHFAKASRTFTKEVQKVIKTKVLFEKMSSEFEAMGGRSGGVYRYPAGMWPFRATWDPMAEDQPGQLLRLLFAYTPCGGEVQQQRDDGCHDDALCSGEVQGDVGGVLEVQGDAAVKPRAARPPSTRRWRSLPSRLPMRRSFGRRPRTCTPTSSARSRPKRRGT